MSYRFTVLREISRAVGRVMAKSLLLVPPAYTKLYPLKYKYQN